jgi:hypothetical protein
MRSPLLVPPLLAAEIGLNEALILQQIHYYCTVSKHIKQDGRHWFWKTLNDWGQTLPFLSTSSIRRAIANLRDKFKLIDIERHSQKTWYQANWFTINAENMEALWNSICQNQQIDATILDKSTCSKPADDIKDSSSLDFSSQEKAALSEKSLEPDWDTLVKENLVWEQNQLARLQDVENQSTPPPVETVVDNRKATPFVDESIKNPLTNDLTRREDASLVPDNEREEENIKLHEVREVVGKLTPNLKKLIANFTLDDLRKALTLYRARQQSQQIRDSYGWLKKCLQQKWWQDNQTSNHQQTDARKDAPVPLTASEKLTDEQKVWYEKAIASGICLPAAIEELPTRMGLVCARVIIPNRRPHDPLFDILPIEKLVVQYQL